MRPNQIRDRKLTGGAPVTESWAKQIRADAYGADVVDAIRKTRLMMLQTSKCQHVPSSSRQGGFHFRSPINLTRLLSLAENPSAEQDHGCIEYANCEKVVLPWEEWSPSALEDHDPQSIYSVGDGIHDAYPPEPVRDVSQRKQRTAQKEEWQVHESLDHAKTFEALHA